MITAYMNVFKDKLESLKKKIKKELSKPRKERDKNFLKDVLKEAKKLKRLIKQMRNETALCCKCPKCGEEIKIEIGD